MMPIALRPKIITIAIPIAIAIVVVVLTSSCGGGSSQPAQAVEWRVSRQVGPQQIKLVTSVDHCGGDSAPALERPVIEYSGRRVFIELLLAPQEELDSGECLLELLGVTKTVTLKRDLNELVLFDSSTDPPARRWPTQ